MGITSASTVGLWGLDAEGPGERDIQLAHLHRLSSWMLILGTVRLLCLLGDYATSYAEISRGAFISLPAVSRFLQTNPPALLLGFAWPLMMGLILRRTRRWTFLPAAAVTFFILSLGGWLTLVAGFWMKADSHIAFGSFEVFRGNLYQFKAGSLAKASMGLTQLVLELGVAVSSWNLMRRMRSTGLLQTAGAGGGAAVRANAASNADGVFELTSKKRLQGRLAIYVSLAFLVLNVRLPVWSAYIEVLNRSRLVREFVLQNDTAHYRGHRAPAGSALNVRRALELEETLNGALRHGAENQFLEAKNDYQRIISAAEAMGNDAESAGFRDFHLARALNNLGWLLATCEEQSLRDAQQAVASAKRAVELAPDEGTYWNTLGVAYYRLRNLPAAMNTLVRSMELRHQGDSFDWYFVAMIHAEQGRPDEARHWYDKAAAWHVGTQPANEELQRFRAEAAEVLGLPIPPPEPAAKRVPPATLMPRPKPSFSGKRGRPRAL
jgi:tetratricopeptide (TPR) repeat protein